MQVVRFFTGLFAGAAGAVVLLIVIAAIHGRWMSPQTWAMQAVPNADGTEMKLSRLGLNARLACREGCDSFVVQRKTR